MKRIAFQCPLIFDEDTNFIIGVKGYTMHSHEKAGVRYKLVYEHEDIRQEAYSKRKFLNPTTGADVTGSTVKVYPYGDLDINLSEKQNQVIMEAYTQKDGFLRIIGFRSPTSSIHYFNNIEKSTFIVPDEAKYEGSIRTLASLLKTLRKKDKVAIVWENSNQIHILLYLYYPPQVLRNTMKGFIFIEFHFWMRLENSLVYYPMILVKSMNWIMIT